MAPLVGAALIAGAGGLLGGIMQSKAQKEMQDEQLAYAREKEEREKEERRRQMLMQLSQRQNEMVSQGYDSQISNVRAKGTEEGNSLAQLMAAYRQAFS